MFAGIDFQSTLRAAQAGDPGSMNVLIERSYASVQQAVHRELAASTRKNRPWLLPLFSTGDVVQEVFISVVRDVDSLKGVTEAGFVGFLASLVRNRLVDTIRFHEAMRRGARVSRALDAEPVGPDRPVDAAAAAEEVQRFCAAMASVPARERSLLADRIQHEHTFAQIAQDLGYPSEDAARKAFYGAQARLLVRLRHAGIAPRGES